jgi:hypothetical protein
MMSAALDEFGVDTTNPNYKGAEKVLLIWVLH